MKAMIVQALPANAANLFFLVLFVFIFTVIVAWAIRPAKTSEFEKAALMPLEAEGEISHG